MDKLLIFNLVSCALIALGLWLSQRYVKSARAQNVLLLSVAAFTVLFHYSAFILRLFGAGDAIAYLKENPNLILPIYPCNLVMWLALVFGFLKNKKSRFAAFVADYIFWFGIISTLVGMFANVDFIRNPTFADYENVKSVGAHATLLFNVLLLPFFGHIKIDVKRNIKSIAISIVGMAVVGVYCNLLFSALASPEVAYDVNSMFLLHSPFDGIPFLTYPVIALLALPLYLGLFALCAYVRRAITRAKNARTEKA